MFKLPLGSLWEKTKLCNCLAWGTHPEEKKKVEDYYFLSFDILSWTKCNGNGYLKSTSTLKALKSNPKIYDENKVHYIMPTCSPNLFSLYKTHSEYSVLSANNYDLAIFDLSLGFYTPKLWFHCMILEEERHKMKL